MRKYLSLEVKGSILRNIRKTFFGKYKRFFWEWSFIFWAGNCFWKIIKNFFIFLIPRNVRIFFLFWKKYKSFLSLGLEISITWNIRKQFFLFVWGNIFFSVFSECFFLFFKLCKFLLKYEKLFKLWNRRFHFLKYKKNFFLRKHNFYQLFKCGFFIFQTLQVPSWNMRSYLSFELERSISWNIIMDQIFGTK